jgi:hypothetical protein
MLIGGGEFMRRRVQLRTVSENNSATNIWIQHLVNRIIIEQLNLPHRLQAKLLHETLPKKTNEVEHIE